MIKTSLASLFKYIALSTTDIFIWILTFQGVEQSGHREAIWQRLGQLCRIVQSSGITVSRKLNVPYWSLPRQGNGAKSDGVTVRLMFWLNAGFLIYLQKTFKVIIIYWYKPKEFWSKESSFTKLSLGSGNNLLTFDFWFQAPVVETLDSAIHQINHYPANKYWGD